MLLSVALSYPVREQADPRVIEIVPHPDAALLTGASFLFCPAAAAAERGPPLKRQQIAFLSEEEEEEEDGIPTQVSLISQDGTQQVQRPGRIRGAANRAGHCF
ncbi:T-complex protein 1 subunit theta [Platysternon megacephalum]|uniref:T-complex protein 1 subunit theta n=1 Tax=Platysternon megacephalum TaxID=55544 RepID=A0A4D9E2I5_9SAUR|nr:T-complex protein 1 subunit theta [Platysternon megacephalum]